MHVDYNNPVDQSLSSILLASLTNPLYAYFSISSVSLFLEANGLPGFVFSGTGFEVDENGDASGMITSFQFDYPNFPTRGGEVGLGMGQSIDLAVLAGQAQLVSTAATTPAYVRALKDFLVLLYGNEGINGGGSEGDDFFEGTRRDDIIQTQGGDDTIQLSRGADQINGGLGSDTLDVNNATLRKGIFTVDLEAGTATLSTDSAVQSNLTSIENVIGSNRDNMLFGNTADNRLDGGRGADLLRGRDGNDRLVGRQGDDILDGGRGKDRLFGGPGDDIMDGGNGRDLLRGGGGADTLDGGRGNDRLDGGAGIDTFIFDGSNGNFGSDTILKLNAEDLLRLTVNNAASVVTSTNAAGDIMITTDSGSILLQGSAGLQVSDLNLTVDTIL